MRELYKNIAHQSPIEDLRKWIINATRMRDIDKQDYDNQVTQNPQIFNVPTNSTTLIGTEKVGDVAADSGFFYVVVDNAGALEWRRVAIVSF